MTNYSVNSQAFVLVATLGISLKKITLEVKFAKRKSAFCSVVQGNLAVASPKEQLYEQVTSNPAFTERNIQKANVYLLYSRQEQKFLVTYHTLQSLCVCVWLVNTLTSTAPIGSPIICMWSPADICEQWERNLSFSSADVRGAGTRDKPLRMSTWEAREGEERFWNSLAASQPKLSRGSKKNKTKQNKKKKNRPADLTGRPSVLWLLHVVQQGT